EVVGRAVVAPAGDDDLPVGLERDRGRVVGLRPDRSRHLAAGPEAGVEHARRGSRAPRDSHEQGAGAQPGPPPHGAYLSRTNASTTTSAPVEAGFRVPAARTRRVGLPAPVATAKASFRQPRT